jgi:hypothetical protein
MSKKVNLLKRMVKEAKGIAQWQEEIYTKLNNLESEVKVLDAFGKFREFIPWVCLDTFVYGGDTGYAITPALPILVMSTGATANYDAFLYTSEKWYSLLDTGKKITVEFIINRLSSVAAQNIWLRLESTFFDPPSETVDHFGFKIINGDLYASNANGTTQTITDTTVDLASGYQRTRLKIVLNPGTDCKFYVNNVLKVTHITNLPNSINYLLHLQIRTTEAVSKEIDLGRVLIEKEYT